MNQCGRRQLAAPDIGKAVEDSGDRRKKDINPGEFDDPDKRQVDGRVRRVRIVRVRQTED